MNFRCKAVLGVVLCAAVFRVSSGQELVTKCSSKGYTHGLPGDVLCQLDRSYLTSSCGLPPGQVQFVFVSPAGTRSTYCVTGFSSFPSAGTPDPANCPSCRCSSDATGSEYTLTFTPNSTVHSNGRFQCEVDCFSGTPTEDYSSCNPIPFSSHDHSDGCNDDCKTGIGAGVGACVVAAGGGAAGYAAYCYFKGVYAKCCKCGKWRRLRMRKLKRDKAKLRLIFLHGGWECNMNPDTNYNSCEKEMDPNIDTEELEKKLKEKCKEITNSGESFEDLNVWVPCASCNKWRRLSSAEFGVCQDKVLSNRWTCNDHPDSTKRTCTAKKESGMEKDCQLQLWAKASKVNVPSPQQRKSGFCPCFRKSANGGPVELKPRDGRAQ